MQKFISRNANLYPLIRYHLSFYKIAQATNISSRISSQIYQTQNTFSTLNPPHKAKFANNQDHTESASHAKQGFNFKSPSKGITTSTSNKNQAQRGSEDIIKTYRSGVDNIIKNKEKGITDSELESYLNHAIKVFVQYKSIPLNEKFRIKENFISELESDYDIWSDNIRNIKATKYEKQSIAIMNLIFKYIFYCYSLHLHSRKLYREIVTQLLFPGTVFQFHTPRRFPITLNYMYRYEEDHQNSQSYVNLMKYLLEEGNFEKILSKSTREDILSILDSISLDTNWDTRLKSTLLKNMISKVEEDVFNDDDILRIFLLLCRGQLLINDLEYSQSLEARFLNINFEKADREKFTRILGNLHNIKGFSKKMYAKTIAFLTQNSSILNEEVLVSLIKSYERGGAFADLSLFLNSYVKDVYAEHTLSGSTLALFIYHMASTKLLDLDLFEALEKYLIINVSKFNLKYDELYGLLSSCIELTYYDSKLFESLMPQARVLLQDSSLPFDKFSSLVRIIAQSNYVASIEDVQMILKRSASYVALSSEKDMNSVVALLHSTGLSIVKYIYQDEEAYQTKYKDIIEKELQPLCSALPNWLNFQNLLLKTPKVQVRVFQFVLTVQMEFPKVFNSIPHNLGPEIINHFETKDFEAKTKTTNLSLDIEAVLKAAGIEFESEYRAYVYFIDAFIKPNIAVQVEGLKHYTRRTRLARSQDLLRDYHLTKLGYRIVKIPFFEFRKIFFTEVAKQKEYINQKVFGENNV